MENQTPNLAIENKPYWSWLIGLLTIWLPKEGGYPESLKNIALATLDRDAVNLRLMADGEKLGRESRWTRGEEREVAHNGGELRDLRGKAICNDVIFNALECVADGLWGRLVQEPGKGTKVELRFGPIFPGTKGIIPPAVLEQFIGEIRMNWTSIRNVWVNDEKRKNQAGQDEFTGRKVANIVISHKDPHAGKRAELGEDEAFFFVRDGLPRLGSQRYQPKDPNYEETNPAENNRTEIAALAPPSKIVPHYRPR